MWQALVQDTRFASARKWPGARPGALRSAWLWFASPGLWILFVHRLSHVCRQLVTSHPRATPLCRLLQVLTTVLQWMIAVSAKTDVYSRTTIEPGVALDDSGHIILGAQHIGTGTFIGAGTTIGMSLHDSAVPDIGRNVYIGPGCMVYGGLSLGDGATLMADTVVTRSVPAGVAVRGNPARVIDRNFDNTPLRLNLVQPDEPRRTAARTPGQQDSGPHCQAGCGVKSD